MRIPESVHLQEVEWVARLGRLVNETISEVRPHPDLENKVIRTMEYKGFKIGYPESFIKAYLRPKEEKG